MTPGPDTIIACPHCGELARLQGWSSGNTSGALTWTDGFVFYPYMPQVPLATRCRKCSRFHLLETAKVIGLDEGSGEYEDAAYIEQLDEHGLLEAVGEIPRLNRDQKLTLRLNALWKANDPIRMRLEGLEGAECVFSKEQLSNIDKLIGMLQEGDDGEQFLRAALLRMAGRFDDALTVMGYIKFTDQFSRITVEFIADLCRERDALLYRVDDSMILRSRPRYANLTPFSAIRRMETARTFRAVLAGIALGPAVFGLGWLINRSDSDWSWKVYFWTALAFVSAIRGGVAIWRHSSPESG